MIADEGPAAAVFCEDSARFDPLTSPSRLTGADGRGGELTAMRISLELALTFVPDNAAPTSSASEGEP